MSTASSFPPTFKAITDFALKFSLLHRQTREQVATETACDLKAGFQSQALGTKGMHDVAWPNSTQWVSYRGVFSSNTGFRDSWNQEGHIQRGSFSQG